MGVFFYERERVWTDENATNLLGGALGQQVQVLVVRVVVVLGGFDARRFLLAVVDDAGRQVALFARHLEARRVLRPTESSMKFSYSFLSAQNASPTLASDTFIHWNPLKKTQTRNA